jgi:hypothetical protein
MVSALALGRSPMVSHPNTLVPQGPLASVWRGYMGTTLYPRGPSLLITGPASPCSVCVSLESRKCSHHVMVFHGQLRSFRAQPHSLGLAQARFSAMILGEASTTSSAPRIYARRLVSNHICLSRLTRASNHCPGQPAASSKYLFATDRPPTALLAHRPSPVLSWLTLSLCAHHPRTDLADIEPSHLRVYPDIQRMSASGDPRP